MALLQATDGNLYGASLGWNNSGLWRMTLSGQYTLLHIMTASDGQCQCNLIQGSGGAIYCRVQRRGRHGVLQHGTHYPHHARRSRHHQGQLYSELTCLAHSQAHQNP